MMNRFAIFVSLISIIFGCTIHVKGGVVGTLYSQPDWLTFHNGGYDIDYPSDWKLDDSGKSGANVIFYAPFDSDADKYRENVNLVVEDLTGKNLDLLGYVQKSESQIKSVLKGCVFEENRIIYNRFSGNYFKFVFSGKSDGIDVKYEQFYWVINNKAFVVTLAVEASKFDTYKVVGEKILNSLIIK